MSVEVVQADVLEWARTYDGPKFHALLTDPPYELAFMGRSWDATGIAFRAETWAALGEHLLPGAFCMAFASTRGYHRMACAIEDAGFRIFPMMLWVTGSSFPKASRIDTQVDKSDATTEKRRREYRFTEWMRGTGITAQQIDGLTSSYMGGHYLSAASQPAIATADMFDKLRPCLPTVPEWVEEYVRQRTIESQQYAAREVIGPGDAGAGKGRPLHDGGFKPEYDITLPSTALASIWAGHRYGGQALKDAATPICVFQKPYAGRPVDSITRYGAGALNIEAARVGCNLTGQRPCITIRDGGAKWAQEKNRSDSSALDVAKSARQEAQAKRGCSAPSNAEQTMSGRGESTQSAISKTDIGCCDGLCQGEQSTVNSTSSNSSIGESGRMPTGQSRQDTLSITSTATGWTTDSKTCNCSQRSNTPDCILSGETSSDPTKQDAESAKPESEPQQPNGRWPSNLLLQHAPGCERVGVRRVRSQSGGDGIAKRETVGYEMGLGERPVHVYADADGYETVDEWRCVEGCPVRALGEQSGVTAGGSAVRNNHKNPYGSERTWSVSATPAQQTAGYPDTGTAARFFQQCDYALEQAEPFSYNGKASRTEREAGLLGHAPCLVCGGYDTLFHIGKAGKKEACHRNGHPTQKPLSLARYLSTLLLPPAEYAPRRILCPFFGTGSEAIGAHLAGWEDVLGIEMEPQYVEWGRARVRHWCGASLPLFAMSEAAS